MEASFLHVTRNCEMCVASLDQVSCQPSMQRCRPSTPPAATTQASSNQVDRTTLAEHEASCAILKSLYYLAFLSPMEGTIAFLFPIGERPMQGMARMVLTTAMLGRKVRGDAAALAIKRWISTANTPSICIAATHTSSLISSLALRVMHNGSRFRHRSCPSATLANRHTSSIPQ